VDANDTVSQTIETVRPRWQDEAQGRGIQIELVKSLDATLTIQATRDELQDDVVNLLLNAIDALPECGTIRVSTQDREGRILLVVTDDGTGMDLETQQRVFEPFFTNKATIGARLGLATVHGTVRR